MRLQQVLMNAVGNAIKFTAQGFVRLDIQLEQDQLQFIVSDTGRGLREEEVQRLFQPFAQADLAIVREFGGSGLGLVVTRQLCQLLGGDYVLLKSALHQGSSFLATTKILSASENIFARKGEILYQTGMRSILSNASQLAGFKILVVEDSLDNQILLEAILHQQGIETEIANNGDEGLDKAVQNEYDLILMDIQMPMMDVHQCVQRLRAKGYSQPIVALSAHAMKDEMDRAYNSGFTDYLSKPISRKALISTVHKHLLVHREKKQQLH